MTVAAQGTQARIKPRTFVVNPATVIDRRYN